MVPIPEPQSLTTVLGVHGSPDFVREEFVKRTNYYVAGVRTRCLSVSTLSHLSQPPGRG